MKQRIYSENAPKAIGPYSQAIKVGTTVYFSGQIPLDPKTQVLIQDDIEKETKQVLINIKAVCEAAGGKLSDIVKLTIYLTDLNHFASVNEVMMEFFQEPYPARSTVQVAGLPKGARIEIEAVMVG